jgi:lipid-A-disaccharide synthase
MDKEIVRELIQHECNAELMISELSKISDGKQGRAEMLASYDELISLLGHSGCSEKMALDLIQYLN